MPIVNGRNIEVIGDGNDIYVVVDGQRIAKRGRPRTPQAGTWVSLQPGWTVSGVKIMEVRYEPPSAQ